MCDFVGLVNSACCHFHQSDVDRAIGIRPFEYQRFLLLDLPYVRREAESSLAVSNYRPQNNQ